jgi:hypothetical protein
MEAKTFEVKAYPEMWKEFGMNVERFEGGIADWPYKELFVKGRQ